MEEKVSASRLCDLLQERHQENFRAFADLFALGCYFHLQGKKKVGLKLVKEVLATVRVHGNKMYLDAISDNLNGNEKQFTTEIHAHSEVNELFE